MQRRALLKLLAATTAVSGLPGTGLALTRKATGKPDWDDLRAQVGSRLLKVDSPLEACAQAGGKGSDALFLKLKNPYYLGDEPALTQTLGWTDGWVSRASDYAVAAESASDVAAAINFARQHGIRPVVKGGGHSYFGNSNGSGSLLIWTRHMRAITLHDAFISGGSIAVHKGRGGCIDWCGCNLGRRLQPGGSYRGAICSRRRLSHGRGSRLCCGWGIW